jgi:hypothetical protein
LQDEYVGLTAITPYGLAGASARVRVHGWLNRLGTPCRVYNYIGAANALPRTLALHLPAVADAERKLHGLDLSDETLLLHREASPLSRGNLEVKLLRAARRSVFDFDDALQWDIGSGLRALIPKEQKAERSVRSANVVVAGSELLADWASRFAQEVNLVPSCVEPDDYHKKTDYELSESPVLGWVGSRSTERYLRLVQEPLLRLHHLTGARLVVVSAGAASLGPLDVMVDRVEWNPATVGAVMTSFDIAIAPLVADLFSRGKCAYKILQYAAAALPVVGAPAGANRQVLGQLGAAEATTNQDWLTQLYDLLSAPAGERAALGATALQGVGRYYSFAAWETVMTRLLGDQQGRSAAVL